MFSDYVGGWKCLNGSFTIQTNFEESSPDLKQFAMEHHGWTESDGELNFARVFSSQTWREEQEGDARYFKHLVENGRFLLQVGAIYRVGHKSKLLILSKCVDKMRR